MTAAKKAAVPKAADAESEQKDVDKSFSTKPTKTVEQAGDDVNPGHDKANDPDVEDALEQVQSVVDKETEQGFRGVEVDQTPNEAYTVGGSNKVPEAEANPTAARAAASNPDAAH